MIVEAYLAENDEKIRADYLQFISLESTPSIVKQQFDETLTKRDELMAEAMQCHLDRGSAFFILGVAHLKGVITFLRQKDNQITPISCSQRPAIWELNLSEVLVDAKKPIEHQSITSIIPKTEENTISSSEQSPKSLQPPKPSTSLTEPMMQKLQPAINQSAFFTLSTSKASPASVKHTEIEKSDSDHKINSSKIKDEQDNCSSICTML